jgi:predicted GNAT family acetyltransferase
VLKDGGQIHFKTDNRDLFEWSLFQFPKAGFALSEVTRNLHEHGVQGVMTDYEEKFHQLGTPINRCVGTKGPLPEVTETTAPEVMIRPMAEGDKLAVLRLSRQREQEGGQALDLTRLNALRCWVAQVGRTVAGYAAGQMEPGQQFRFLEWYVDPEYRGAGVGDELMAGAEADLRQEGTTPVKNL